MKEIRLGNGMCALVDDEDYQYLSQYKWQARMGGSGAAYAARSGLKRDGQRGKSISMHRQIMGFPKGMDVHHVNRNTLDNRRENLEICTRKKNLSMRKQRRNRSGITGVYSTHGKWRMYLSRDFDNPIDAGEAYRIAYEALQKVFPVYRE